MPEWKCTRCDGDGRIEVVIQREKKCWNCNGRGWGRHNRNSDETTTCERCGGSGILVQEITESETCPQCSGRGYRDD